jgi:hypothetical protein
MSEVNVIETPVVTENVIEKVSNESTVPEGKFLTQEQIDAIAKTAHARGYQKGSNQVQQQNSEVPSRPVIPHDEIKKIVAEETAKAIRDAHAEAELNAIGSQLKAKIDTAANKYSDFHQKVGSLNFDAMPPNLLKSISMMENSADILYDIANNPYKIPNLYGLAVAQPNIIDGELKKLSNSIRVNQNQSYYVNEPLPEINNSSMGANNSSNTDGVPSWDYFNKKFSHHG